MYVLLTDTLFNGAKQCDFYNGPVHGFLSFADVEGGLGTLMAG